MAGPLKVCLVGPERTGKSFLSKLLAEQSVAEEEVYQPTAGVRIQELSRTIRHQGVKVQLWDCSGGAQYRAYWPVLAKGLDGLLMVYDPAQPAHEQEMEKLYTSFAQPSRLTTSQCMTLGISLTPGGGGAGLQGKLQKLQGGTLDLSQGNFAASQADGLELLDKLLEGCMARKKDKAAKGDA
eukprot:jgi/Tetstr1/439818/TSEL_028229.t1